jgi:CRISPR-associated protein Csb2
VRGVALVLPANCSDLDREALERAVQGWRSHGQMELNLPARHGRDAARFLLEDLGFQRAAGEDLGWANWDVAVARRSLVRGFWCRAARVWRTVTPIALDRFPGDLRNRNPQRRTRAEAEATAAVARACGFAGLPKPVEVAIRLHATLTGVPALPSANRRVGYRYPGYLTGRGEPRVCVHAVIEFAEPVRGPVLVGAGRYFGYGLCLPDTWRGA